MKLTRTKTEITFENRQRTTIRLHRELVVWCERCAAPVRMLPPEEAAALLQTTVRAIFRRVEAGEIHFLETEGGALLVCHNSIDIA